MKKHGMAAALLTATVLLGPASSAWAVDNSEDTRHGDRHRCSHHDDDHWHDDGYSGDYKYRSYGGDNLQDHNRTGDDWRDQRCHRKCGKGDHDWRHGDDRCHRHGHGDGHHH
jgi:hypothetical protein